PPMRIRSPHSGLPFSSRRSEIFLAAVSVNVIIPASLGASPARGVRLRPHYSRGLRAPWAASQDPPRSPPPRGAAPPPGGGGGGRGRADGGAPPAAGAPPPPPPGGGGGGRPPQ